MAVPIPLVAGIAVIVVLVILLIIYKLLKKKRQAAGRDASKNSSKKGEKGDYEKLEEGDHEFDELEPEMDHEDGPKGSKSKNKKKKRRGKGKGKTKDLEGTTDQNNDVLNGAPNDSTQELIGRLQISASYVASNRQVLVIVHQGENLGNGVTSSFEVRLTLLPYKRQRFKTKSQLSANPFFDELFTFEDVPPEEFEIACLRARVYQLNGRKRNLVGEIRAELLTDLGLDASNVEALWREITSANEIADDISDTVMVTDPGTALMAPKETVPTLQISLQHKTISGKLTVEIIKARHMKTLSIQKAPETYVQVVLRNSHGRDIANGTTPTCKESFHPTFEHSFYFPAIEFELGGLTLVFSVYCKKLRKKELIGWFSIGRESTGERERLHWDEMIEARGEPIKGWYALSSG